MRSTPLPLGLIQQLVTAVGTAFTIHKLDSVDLQLTVKEGKVALTNPSGILIAESRPAGMLLAQARTGLVKITEPGAADWWLQQQMRLQNISLEELIDRIEKYYQVKLTYGTIDKNKKVTLTWDLTISLQDNLTVLNTLTSLNIH